jgi:hypothetical protein
LQAGTPFMLYPQTVVYGVASQMFVPGVVFIVGFFIAGGHIL